MESTTVTNAALPTLEPATQTTGSQELGRDEFLRLLIAQLENQDPLDPQDPTEFTAQLAQFSSLEQLVSIRSAIDTLGASGDLPGVVELSSLIGRDVTAESGQIELGQPGGSAPAFQVTLSAGASDVRVEVVDDSGRTVRSLALGALGQGSHPVVWDGLSDSGAPLAPGLYSLVVDAGEDGASLEATTSVAGRVTAVLPGRDGAAGTVMLGNVPIPLDGISEVRETGAGS
ncbi:MAG: flagellar hook assembly protein FlgD [Myxococcota bacterium]